MFLTKLVFTLIFCQLIADLDACPKGQRIKFRGNHKVCEDCPDESYKPGEEDSISCRPCRKCDESKGSSVKQKCTKETNTECECQKGFVLFDNDASTCKCDIGSELKNGVCSKCKDRHFSSEINSQCKPWKECESGVSVQGSSTSDTICNESTRNSSSYVTDSPPQRSHEMLHTESRLNTAAATTTAPPGHKVNPTEKRKIQLPDSYAGNHIGMVLIILGIIGLLLLTAVTCKLHNTPCVQRKLRVPKNDSCRRPVEESGDSSLSSSLKLNPGEP